MSESFFSLIILVNYKKMAALISHIQLPTLAEVGLAIYISASANTITTPVMKLKDSKPRLSVVTNHTANLKHVYLCTIEGCSQKRKRKGVCRSHGGVTYCTVDGCSKKNKGGGLCSAHGDEKLCSIDGCNKIHGGTLVYAPFPAAHAQILHLQRLGFF